MASCAIEKCADPLCACCTVNERFKVEPCVTQWCRFVFGHRGECEKSTRAEKVERAELKESKALPDLSGPRAAALALGRKRRYREGAVRQQR